MDGELQTQLSTKVRYVVPLCDFEKILLEELGQVLEERCFTASATRDYSVEEVFRRWKWGVLVSSGLKDYLYGEAFEREYKGDKSLAYNAFGSSLTRGEMKEQCIARADLIQNANPDFLTKLGTKPVDALDVQPPDEDLRYWKTIAEIYPECLPWALQLRSLQHHSFDIFRLIKVFTIRWQYPQSRDHARRTFLASPAFRECWNTEVRPKQSAECDIISPEPASSYGDTETVSDSPAEDIVEDDDFSEDEGLVITKKLPPGSGARWPETEPKYDKGEQISKDYLTFLLYGLGRHKELECPWDYIHFIPCEDLEPSELSCLHDSGVSTDVPFDTAGEACSWVLWMPPYQGFGWNHHLHTEDEAYEYTLKRWSLPDHYCGEKVVFRVREITKTDLIKDLGMYWTFWNDCAITQGTDDDASFLVLETIPGLRFRSRRKYQDEVSALSYFRNLVEAHANGTLDAPDVREVIGLEASYQPAFKYSLRLISEGELHDIAWERPLGKGSNGMVYSASWRKPGGVLKSSAPREVKVVLKDVKSRFGTSQESRKKLIKELDATFASLGGSATACVEFLGVTLLKGPSTKIAEIQQELRLFLVFERATQNSLAEFLPLWYKSMTFFESWDKTVSALASIGTGISSLHEHEVLHRDLHLNNILVTDRFYPHDPEFPHEFGFLITDIGEGKILREGREFVDLSDHVASYGAVDFRAPEVHGSEGWTTKAEVFSFGVIACKVFRNRQYACTAAPSVWVLEQLQGNGQHVEQKTTTTGSPIVPSKLRKIIEPCLSYSPDARPTMREVVRQLDDFSLDLVIDKDEGYTEEDLDIEWSHWDWEDSLRRGLSSQKAEPRTQRTETDEDPLEERTQRLSLD